VRSILKHKLAHTTVQHKSEKGFALLMVIFIISLSTILVTVFSSDTFAFLKRNRSLTDGLEAEYAAHSGMNLAITTLELPDDPSLPIKPWQILNSMPSLPIPGFSGEIRVQIFDEGGKINLNSIVGSSLGGSTPNPGSTAGQDPTGGNHLQTDVSDVWKFALSELFTQLGAEEQGFNRTRDSNEERSPNALTLGGTPLPASQLVASLHDWIDADSQAFSSPNFPANGLEGAGNQEWFLNRPLKALDELARVPGFTNEFLQRLSPYVRAASTSDFRINVNTAPPLVLQAIGFSQTEIGDIVKRRSVQWLTTDELQSMVQGSANLPRITTVSSGSFKILVRARSASTTKWLEAECLVQSGFGRKVASIKSTRFF